MVKGKRMSQVKGNPSVAAGNHDSAQGKARQARAVVAGKKFSGTSLCFSFEVHHPFLLRNYTFDQIGENHFYENYKQNTADFNNIADQYYLPVNAKLLDLMTLHKGKFKVAFSFSGCALEHFEMYRPDLLRSFQALVASGFAEVFGETYYHSLSFSYSKNEFERQVKKHEKKVMAIFNTVPSVFRYTDLFYSNELADRVAAMGYKGMMCKATDQALKGRSTDHLYLSPDNINFSLLLNHQRSENHLGLPDSGRRKDNQSQVSAFFDGIHGNAEAINVFLNYEQLCKSDRDGKFLSNLSDVIAAKSDYALRAPTEVIASYTPRDVYDFPGMTREEETQSGLLNEMQRGALEKIYSLEQSVMQTRNENLIKVWGKLQASDHFRFMSTDFWTNGKRPHDLSSFESPYDACICYMNVLADLEKTIQQEQSA